ENGTFQTWDAKTGRILSVSEANPNDQAFIKKPRKVSVKTDYLNFYLTNPETAEVWTLKRLSSISPAYEISNDEKFLAEGGTWGHAVVGVSEIRNPANSYELKGGRIPLYVQTELETKMLQQQAQRRATLDELRAQRDKQAAIDSESFKRQVYINFDH